MLHTCVQRFDVTENLEKICKILGTKQTPSEKLGAGEGNEVKLATCRFQRCTHSWRTATMDSDIRDVERSMDG